MLTPLTFAARSQFEAMQFDGSNATEVISWSGDGTATSGGTAPNETLAINTDQSVNIGEWVIKAPDDSVSIITTANLYAGYCPEAFDAGLVAQQPNMHWAAQQVIAGNTVARAVWPGGLAMRLATTAEIDAEIAANPTSRRSDHAICLERSAATWSRRNLFYPTPYHVFEDSVDAMRSVDWKVLP